MLQGPQHSILQGNLIDSVAFIQSTDGTSPSLVNSFGMDAHRPTFEKQPSFNNLNKSSNQGLSVLEKLQKEGLFNFKNLQP